MLSQLMTCRFCGKFGYDDDDFVKYGVRHYAHHKCFLKLPDAAKRVVELHQWQIKEMLGNTTSKDWPIELYCLAEILIRREG